MFFFVKWKVRKCNLLIIFLHHMSKPLSSVFDCRRGFNKITATKTSIKKAEFSTQAVCHGQRGRRLGVEVTARALQRRVMSY